MIFAASAAIAPAIWRWKELYDHVEPGSNSNGACLCWMDRGYPNHTHWLVVGPPLWKILVGMIIPNIWENKKCSKPPTSPHVYCCFRLPPCLIKWYQMNGIQTWIEDYWSISEEHSPHFSTTYQSDRGSKDQTSKSVLYFETPPAYGAGQEQGLAGPCTEGKPLSAEPNLTKFPWKSLCPQLRLSRSHPFVSRCW